jgi:hypothetical protein
MTGVGAGDVRVSGGATAEEVAVVLAALRGGPDASGPAESPYAQWRRTRLRALRDVAPAGPAIRG